jgi:hypothetical protein
MRIGESGEISAKGIEGRPPYLPDEVFAPHSVSGVDHSFLYLCLDQEAAYRKWAENSARHILVILPENGRGIGYARRRIQDVAAYFKLKTSWQVSWLQSYLSRSLFWSFLFLLIHHFSEVRQTTH